MEKKSGRDYFEYLLSSDVPPVKLGNSNKTGRCGMCGVFAFKLYPYKVGQVEFMICDYCYSIMGIGR